MGMDLQDSYFFFPEEFLVSNFTKFWCSGNMVLFNMLCVSFFT